MLQQDYAGSHFSNSLDSQQRDRMRDGMNLAAAAIIKWRVRGPEYPECQAVVFEYYIGNVLKGGLFVDLEQHLFNGPGERGKFSHPRDIRQELEEFIG